jgi:hypothetical protein
MPAPVRWAAVLLAGSAALACDGSEPSDIPLVLLTTDAASYTLESPGSGPAVSMAPRVRNQSDGDITIDVCGGDVDAATLGYERRDESGDWITMPYAGLDCTTLPTRELVIPPGDAPIPPGRWRPANDPGTYRIKMAWRHRFQSATDTAYSAPYVVNPGPEQR